MARLRVLLAFALLAAAVPVAPAMAAPGSYDHGWKAEGIASGEIGMSVKNVLVESVTLGLVGGRYAGVVRYEDIAGFDAGGSFSQAAFIELELIGGPDAGGSQALGHFIGTAKLELRDTGSAAAGADRALLGTPAKETVVYDVSGRWAADIIGADVRGEILYETAEAVSREPRGAIVRDASWFNRLSGEFPDELGGVQGFGATLTRDAPAPRPFWGTVARGLRGGDPKAAVAASQEMASGGAALSAARPGGAAALPGGAAVVDVTLAGTYLDAKNRAAGLLGEDGPAGPFVDGLRGAWPVAFAAVAGRPAPDDVAADALARIEAAVAAGAAEGGSELLAAAKAAAGSGPDAATRLRVRAAVAEAAASPRPYTSVLAGTAEAARAVLETEILREGPAADAVLAAARSPKAPESARAVAAFTREAGADAPAARGKSLVAGVLSRHGDGADGETRGLTPPGIARVAPVSWLAYRRADGTAYWLAGEGGEWALTDGSLRGWGIVTKRAFLVDAADVGRVVASYPTP